MADNIETKKCPFCGEQIPVNAAKCKFCGEYVTTNTEDNSELEYNYNGIIEVFGDIVKFMKSPMFKLLIKSILIFGIIIFILWVFFFDYPAAVSNHNGFWYGQYLISGILHTLLAILFALILLLLKK